MRRWELVSSMRPWTANTERRLHHHARAKLVAECRQLFAWLAVEARIPRLDSVRVTAQPLSTDRRWRPDVAACFPAVKAAIDGLVDAGVLVDDDDERVRSVTFLPIDSSAEFAGLRLIIEETTWTS